VTGGAGRALPWLVAGIGGALVVVGPALLLASGAEPVTAPLGGYAPLETEGLGAYRSTLTLTYVDPGTVRTTVGQLVGGGVLVLGLLVLTAVACWAVGVRSAVRRAR